MQNYKVQSGCWNCKHRFVTSDDEGIFCNIGQDRPMYWQEIPGILSVGGGYEKWSIEWDSWADVHEVNVPGICDNHETP